MSGKEESKNVFIVTCASNEGQDGELTAVSVYTDPKSLEDAITLECSSRNLAKKIINMGGYRPDDFSSIKIQNVGVNPPKLSPPSRSTFNDVDFLEYTGNGESEGESEKKVLKSEKKNVEEFVSSLIYSGEYSGDYKQKIKRITENLFEYMNEKYAIKCCRMEMLDKKYKCKHKIISNDECINVVPLYQVIIDNVDLPSFVSSTDKGVQLFAQMVNKVKLEEQLNEAYLRDIGKFESE